MRNMRKVVWLVSVIAAIVLAGCQKETEKEFLTTEREDFVYTVPEEVYAITADEAGILYTIRRMPMEASGEAVPGNIVEGYDMDGSLICQQKLTFSLGDIQLPLIEDGKMYCISNYNLVNYLYEVDLATWEARQLTELPSYQRFMQMVRLGDYLYVLGQTGSSKTFALFPGVWSVNNQGEQIFRLNLAEEDSKPEMMKVEFPIGIYGIGQDRLMIYQYTEEKGFGFLQFNQEEMTLTEYEWTHAEYARDSLSGCGEGYVCQKGLKVFYGTPTGTQVQLLPENLLLMQPAVCQNGFVFLLGVNDTSAVRRICIANVMRDNKEICVLTDDSPNDFPYGCGYQMTTISAAPNEFALKVLAGDGDFDLFVLDTRNDCAYNLKENGAFYALNKVEGVKEYLDACFPYIKELAYNEDGDIWMIPVDVDIPGLAYNREFCKERGVDYSTMNYMEFMEFIEKTEATEPEKIYISIGTILEPMLMQYLSKYDTFDTELFRNHISKLKQIYTDATTWGYRNIFGRKLENGVPTEFYLEFVYNSDEFEEKAKDEVISWAYAPSGFPKLEEDISNVGTITLLAVNPKSANLKETLRYVTEYCRYMLTLQDSFLLKEESTYTMENAFVRDLYQLMAGATIEFRMSDEVYESTLWDYLEGEIGLEEAIAEIERKMKIYRGE